MRLIPRLLIVLLVMGGALWWFSDSLPFFRQREAVSVSPQAAADAEAKLTRLNAGPDEVRLSSVEITSLLRYGNADWAPRSIREPEVRMRGDTLTISALIPTDGIPSHPDLERVRAFLPDTARVEVEGGVRMIATGRAALAVRQVEFAGVPIPERYYPPMLDQLGRGDAPGLTPVEMPLPLPSGVSQVRVVDGYLVLTP